MVDSENVKPPSRGWLWIKIPALVLLSCLVFEVLFLAWYWFVPPWGEIRDGKIPASTLIEDYQDKVADDPKLPPLRWKPFTKAVPRSISKVFILAEDSRFYEHDGFDYEAIAAAVQYNWKKGKLARGASTISQQTAKNLFLSLSRSPIRKWHEILLTYMLEAKLNKAQILHAYLNVAEFGTGIYGIEAASQAYFRHGAASLTQQQAAQLAATLPSPKKHNPKTLTRVFQQRNRRVSFAIRMVDQYLVQRGKKDTGATSAQDMPSAAELAEKLREVMADPAGENGETLEHNETKNEHETEASPAPIENENENDTPASEASGEELDARRTEPAPVEAPAPPEETPTPVEEGTPP